MPANTRGGRRTDRSGGPGEEIVSARQPREPETARAGNCQAPEGQRLADSGNALGRLLFNGRLAAVAGLSRGQADYRQADFRRNAQTKANAC